MQLQYQNALSEMISSHFLPSVPSFIDQAIQIGHTYINFDRCRLFNVIWVGIESSYDSVTFVLLPADPIFKYYIEIVNLLKPSKEVGFYYSLLLANMYLANYLNFLYHVWFVLERGISTISQNENLILLILSISLFLFQVSNITELVAKRTHFIDRVVCYLFQIHAPIVNSWIFRQRFKH